MQTILVVAHLFLAIGIVTLVLLQHGRGADAGAAFGSGASSTVFGARGSTSFLSRGTAVLATLFFMTSMALAYYASQTGKPEALIERAAPAVAVPPAAPTQSPEVPVVPEPVAETPVSPPAVPEVPVPPAEPVAPQAKTDSSSGAVADTSEPTADEAPDAAGDVPSVDPTPGKE
jgi:preprotein translocase subunit SecG